MDFPYMIDDHGVKVQKNSKKIPSQLAMEIHGVSMASRLRYKRRLETIYKDRDPSKAAAPVEEA